jgi:hypothetical protein
VDDEVPSARSVRRQRRPRQRGRHLDEGSTPHPAGAGTPVRPPGGLGEADLPVADDRCRSEVRQGDGREGHRRPAVPDGRRPDAPAADWPWSTMRPSSTSIQACRTLAKRKRSALAQLLELRRPVDQVGWCVVVVGDAHPERQLRQALIASEGIQDTDITVDSTRMG